MKRMEAYISTAGTIHKTKNDAAVADVASILNCTESVAKRVVERRVAIIDTLHQVDAYDFQIPAHNPSDDPEPVEPPAPERVYPELAGGPIGYDARDVTPAKDPGSAALAFVDYAIDRASQT